MRCFALVCFAWVFFRADSWQHATDMLAGMTKGWSQGLSGWGQMRTFWAGTDERFFMLYFVLFMVLEWLQFRRGIRWMWRGIWRHAWVEALFVLGALMFSLRNEASTFIYFAF